MHKVECQAQAQAQRRLDQGMEDAHFGRSMGKPNAELTGQVGDNGFQGDLPRDHTSCVIAPRAAMRMFLERRAITYDHITLTSRNTEDDRVVLYEMASQDAVS